jgi:hypothetical protein
MSDGKVDFVRNVGTTHHTSTRYVVVGGGLPPPPMYLLPLPLLYPPL